MSTRLSKKLSPASQVTKALSEYLASHPGEAERLLEQVNSTFLASSPTQEDWYWGRLATGGEEDYYWRR